MKIGIDCRIFSSKFTGIGRYTHELVDNIVELNKKLSKPHQLVLFFNNPEYREFKVPLNTKKILVNAKHYSLAEQTRFLRILNKEKCDLVHFPHFNIPIFYNKPYIVTIHDLTLNFFPGQKMTRFYHRLAYKWTIKNAIQKAKKIITVSNNTKQDLVKHLKAPIEKIETIYLGINPEFKLIADPEIINPTVKKHHITKSFLLYTGVWRNHKNLPRLIRAFNLLITKHKLDLQLVITGKPDPHYPEIQNTVAGLGLQQDVIFPGLVPEKEIIHLYNAAHIFVFPSLYEGFGLPPLEAMRCGTPVIASNTSSIPEICGPDNAIYFDPRKTEAISNAILKLHKDPDKQAVLIDNGLQHSRKFSWQTMSAKTFDIICSNLSNNT